MQVITVTQSDFKQSVLENQQPVFVDFYADWCAPCRITGPIIDQLAEETQGVKFVKIDVDKNPELATEYSVFSIPTFIIFNQGKIVTQMVGAQSKEGFLQEINKAVGK